MIVGSIDGDGTLALMITFCVKKNINAVNTSVSTKYSVRIRLPLFLFLRFLLLLSSIFALPKLLSSGRQFFRLQDLLKQLRRLRRDRPL